MSHVVSKKSYGNVSKTQFGTNIGAKHITIPNPEHNLNVAPHVVVVMVVIVVWLFRWCEADVFVHSENAPLKIGNDS